MFPSFSESRIRQFIVSRERYVEPIHRIGAGPVPGFATGVDGLHFASTAHIYPALSNGEAVTRHARHVVDELLRLPRAAALTSSTNTRVSHAAVTATP